MQNHEGAPRRFHLMFHRGWESTRRKKVEKSEIRKVEQNPYETKSESDWGKCKILKALQGAFTLCFIVVA